MSGKALKLIALITMIIDHFACAVVFMMTRDNPGLRETYRMLRHIGRIAFPIYGFLIVEGFTYTKNIKKYICAIGVCALISEIPFNLTVSRGAYLCPDHQNVFLTILMSLLAMTVIKKICECFGPEDMLRYDLALLVTALTALAGYLVRCDYKHAGVLMMLAMYFVRGLAGWVKNLPYVFAAMGTVACLILTIYSKNEIYAFAALFPILFYNGQRGNIRHKYFYYLVYPVHLLIFGLAARYMTTGGVFLMSSPIYEKLVRCLEDVRKQTDFVPQVALVLGSGLGDFADGIRQEVRVEYSSIEGFPVSTVPGHEGAFIFGYVGDVKVVCMKGRVHFYEGYAIEDVVLPVRLMRLMGAHTLILTNASGGINPGFKAGDLMMLTDHISIFAPNPLIGPNIEELGTRFPDMSHVYDPKLAEIFRQSAKELSIDLKEGVYVQLTGPSFESPAEIRMLGKMGADAVGMSTVVEAVAANHMGMRIGGVSCVCNMAAGIQKTPLTHDEVQAAAAENAPRFKALITKAIEKAGEADA